MRHNGITETKDTNIYFSVMEDKCISVEERWESINVVAFELKELR